MLVLIFKFLTSLTLKIGYSTEFRATSLQKRISSTTLLREFCRATFQVFVNLDNVLRRSSEKYKVTRFSEMKIFEFSKGTIKILKIAANADIDETYKDLFLAKQS